VNSDSITVLGDVGWGKQQKHFLLWQVDILLKCSVCYIRMHVIGFEVDPLLTFVSLGFFFVSLSLLAMSNCPDIHNFFMLFKYSV
jgi:hypothetical protein